MLGIKILVIENEVGSEGYQQSLVNTYYYANTSILYYYAIRWYKYDDTNAVILILLCYTMIQIWWYLCGLCKYDYTSKIIIKIFWTNNYCIILGIDHELLLQHTSKEEIILMNNGCICCSGNQYHHHIYHHFNHHHHIIDNAVMHKFH